MHNKLNNGAEADIPCLHIDFPKGCIQTENWEIQHEELVPKFLDWVKQRSGITLGLYDEMAGSITVFVDGDLRDIPKILDAVESFDFESWKEK
jgi:hypothetical protein